MKHYGKDRSGEREVIEYITFDDVEKAIMATLSRYGIVFDDTKPELARDVFAELYKAHQRKQESRRVITANVWRVVVTAGLTGSAIAVWEYAKTAVKGG